MKLLGESPTGERDEIGALAALERAGFSVARTVCLEAADGASGALAALDATEAAVLGVVVRAAQPSSTPWTAIVASPTAPLRFAREAAATIADVVGVPASRFLASAAESTREALDADLDATVLRATREAWPSGLEARVGFLLARARKRLGDAPLMVQRLDDPGPYGIAATRETRTGRGPVRASVSHGPLSLSDGPSTPQPLDEVDALAAVRAKLEAAAKQLEADARRVVRIAFSAGPGGPTFVSVAPQRQTARAACAIAVDLASAGTIREEEALELVDPAELAACCPAAIVQSSVTPIASGVAAGGGIARGRAVFTTSRAIALARVGVTPLLVVPEVEPEDVAALRAASGIIVIRGGITGEAAIMARALGKPCVAAGTIVRSRGEEAEPSPHAVRELQPLTVDGGSGRVMAGSVILEPGDEPPEVHALLELAGHAGRTVVHALATCPEDVETAQRFGATNVVVWNVEEIMFDALRCGGDVGDAVTERLGRVLAAASRHSISVAVRLATPTSALVEAAGQSAAQSEALTTGILRALDAATSVTEIVEDAGFETPARPGRVRSRVGAAGGEVRSWGPFADTWAGSVAVVLDPKALAVAASVAAELACPPVLVRAARFAAARGRRVYRPTPA